MNHEIKLFAIKLGMTLVATPVMGYVIMKCGESFEKAWKTQNRRKKWLASCGFFLLLAAISGWLV